MFNGCDQNPVVSALTAHLQCSLNGCGFSVAQMFTNASDEFAIFSFAQEILH